MTAASMAVLVGPGPMAQTRMPLSASEIAITLVNRFTAPLLTGYGTEPCCTSTEFTEPMLMMTPREAMRWSSAW